MTNEAKHKEIIMQKNEFEVMVKELLPDVTAQAMEKWTQYAQELEQDGTEKERDLYDAAYVELRLIKEHQGELIATSLFNYGEQSIILNCVVRRQSSPRAGRWSRSAIIPLKMAVTRPARNTGNLHRRCRRSAASRSIHFPARCACNMLRFAALLCCLL